MRWRKTETVFEKRVREIVQGREDFFADPPIQWALLGKTAGDAFRRFVANLLELDPQVRLASTLLEGTFVANFAQPAAKNGGCSDQRAEALTVGNKGQPAASLVPGSVAALLHDPGEYKTATYRKNNALAFMEAVGAPGQQKIPLTPQPVVNWLYQVLAIALQTMQGFLGTKHRFNAGGVYVPDTQNAVECQAVGGQCCVFWGTELGSRRDQSMISWDFDADIAVFVTDSAIFGNVWQQTKRVLEPLGLRLIEHTNGFKYRITPTMPLDFACWKELLHEAAREPRGAETRTCADSSEEAQSESNAKTSFWSKLRRC
jgi:hypothetical protein